MNKGYAVFCDADRVFYDAPHRLLDDTADDSSGKGSGYAPARLPVPPGWQRHRSGDWLALRPLDTALPPQGWKIHVSACLDNAESILERVMDYCVERRAAFKFISSRYLLHTRNAKYADRSASGKFITVYPADDQQFGDIAADLDALLAGEQGPYILSDLRWGAGPVHVRYGSFTQRNCYGDNGELCPAIENAEGQLVPDVRGPAFRVPDWVTPPAVLRPHLDARARTTVTEMPYTIERALHFSNGGGVYVGKDSRTGERVVLKEARPHAGLAADGADAVARLERERAALEQLSGLACTPEVHDTFVLGDHHFLVLEYVEGQTLNNFFARRHPLIDPDPDAERLAAYTQWALRVYGLVEKAVEDIHARGVAFNDLHLFNIMVSEDEESVVLLDFEAAARIEDGARQVVANPAFVAPADRRGADIDRYALACLRIALFLPLTSLFAVDRGKAAHLADIIAGQFPVPRGFLDEAVEEILRDTGGPAGEDRSASAKDTTGEALRAPAGRTPAKDPAKDTAREGWLPVDPGDWPRSRDSMVRAVLASATPDREDRFFPGDIAQFAAAGGGLSFGYGAAGVLYALAESGAAPCPEAEEWLLARTKQPASGTPLGFYDGLAGTAWTLHRLGHPERALELADIVLGQPWDSIAPDLHSGLSGVGLALGSLAAATGESALHDAAVRCADLVAGSLKSGPESVRAGLLHGASGPALLFLRLYERTGDRGLLDLAADALRRDLARCVTSEGGALQVSEGWRTMPYLGAGSVGIGMVIDDFLARTGGREGRDEYDDFEQARHGILAAAQATFYAQPGLLRGAAGMVLHLSRTTTDSPGAGAASVRRQISALGSHAMAYRGELAFPGEQMMRLSMDLATGTAGCLLALAAAAPDSRAHLPFLPPLQRPTSRSLPGAVTEHTRPNHKRGKQ
ncbi:class III lanthionine synthetase LanKC [Streptomyces hypolithicus]